MRLRATRLRVAAQGKGVAAPAGYILLVDDDGSYLTDPDGTYLMEAI